jgi:hypothetical protein
MDSKLAGNVWWSCFSARILSFLCVYVKSGGEDGRREQTNADTACLTTTIEEKPMIVSADHDLIHGDVKARLTDGALASDGESCCAIASYGLWNKVFNKDILQVRLMRLKISQAKFMIRHIRGCAACYDHIK